MKHFDYVSKKDCMPVKKELIELINTIQDEVRDKFTFQYTFTGSAKYNLVTMDKSSNIGYDFDIDIRVNNDNENYSAKQIRTIFKTALDKYSRQYGYDYAEDSTRVLTIKVKDRKKSRIIHSADIAFIRDYDDGSQEYIHFNKNQNTYSWQEQPDSYYNLESNIELIKDHCLWQNVRDRYLEKKNDNPQNKKSRSLFAETINDIITQNFDD